MRNVLLLHTTEAAHYITNREKKKPYSFKIYNCSKGGIDIADQRMGSLTCKKMDTCCISLFPWYKQSQQSSNTYNEYKGCRYKKLWIWLGINDMAYQTSHE